MKTHDKKKNQNPRPNSGESRRMPTLPDQNPTDASLDEIEIFKSDNIFSAVEASYGQHDKQQGGDRKSVV